MASVYQQLEAMRGITENWDGYQAAPPSADVVDLAHEFAAFIEAAQSRLDPDLFLVHVSPTRTGGILIEWEDARAQHEVEINADRCISFLHLNKSDGTIATRRFSPLIPTVVDPGLLQELRRLLAA